MWILDCDGDLFHDKKIWLRPGKSFLFGRTRADPTPGHHSYAISNKSVSRKHLLIAVDNVVPGSGTTVDIKSKVTITDESKIGTYLDGEKFVKESRTLKKNENAIRLGSFDQTFRITWLPVVFTFSLTVKPGQSDAEKLTPYLEKLEPLDIKAINVYHPAHTTHVISGKRNIAKGLQALVNGKHIVTEGFIEAILAIAVIADAASDKQSPLEQDFNAHWPDPLLYLPTPGKEPNPRSAASFAPNPARINVFTGYTFIFADQPQYEQLRGPLENAHAKCLLYDLKLGETTLREFCTYVRDVAKQKGAPDFLDTHAGKGVVVVRFRGKGDTAQWAIHFIQDMDAELGQRSIEQNEFLDAILSNDASGLRRPLLEEDTEGLGRTSSNTTPNQNAMKVTSLREKTPSPSPKEPPSSDRKPMAESPTKIESLKTSIAKHRARRTITQSRFTGFDDFDASQLSKRHDSSNSPPSEDDEAPVDSQLQISGAMQGDSQSLFLSDSQPALRKSGLSSTTRKRKPSASPPKEDGDDVNAMVNDLLPAAAAMKRRRLAEGSDGPASVKEKPATGEAVFAKPKKKATRKDLDVLSVMRSYAKDLDAINPLESQSQSQVHLQDGDTDIAQLRNLALVEDMEVLPRKNITGEGLNDRTSNKWEERWNGRKNFKKFRRKGEPPKTERSKKVIVGLQEVKLKDFGIGEAYWLEPSERTKTKGRKSQSQSQRMQQPETHVIEDDDPANVIPEEIAGQPRSGPVADALAEQQRTLSKGKRPSSNDSVKTAPPPKKQRQTRIEPLPEDDSDEDDEGELRFRFRKKR